MVDQDVTHHLCTHGVEMRTVVPLETILTGKFQIRFVDQRGCLQSMTRPFLAHLPASDATEFVVYERIEFVERRPVAPTPIGE